ncbi:SGNH hydrolase-type esterase domain-containing protein [Gorgonomyces haynaldii]|nr:SGNH hydrolase-type esterase domain-containing protein [Gorgonomyces haynaldii]
METQPLLGERRKPNRRIWIVSLCFVVTLLLLLFPTRAPDLNILCLGDSLTQGITDGQDHPYTIELAKRFKESGIFVRIDNIGVSGDRVLPPGRMRPRLTYALAQAERQHLKYDWVLILGGINDLGVHEEAHRLFYGLRNLWRISTTHGAHVLAMNMLEWSLEAHDPVLKANVSAYNHLIETHSKQVPFKRDKSTG